VRNEPDGRVEALVEGEAEAVTRVERALRTGPRGARVATFNSYDEPPQGLRGPFEIV
jgi:acylphosphatase